MTPFLLLTQVINKQETRSLPFITSPSVPTLLTPLNVSLPPFPSALLPLSLGV